MKQATACLVGLFLMFLSLPMRCHGLRIYKTREDLLNLLGSDEVGEEQLYMEYCKQSSPTGNCMLAIDNAVLHEWTQCASTEPEDSGWWKAQLETPAYVTRVVVNTVELPNVAMKSALADFVILASEFVCYRHVSSMPFESKSFPCDALADEITIQSYRNKAILSLCEIIPYGVPVTFKGMETGEMEVSMGDCYQSSVEQGRECKYALDRNFETSMAKGTKICSESKVEPRAWWVAYFPLPTLVKYVKLFLRSDCCKSLTNFIIKVNEMVCAKYHNTESFTSRVFKCERFGSHVAIENQSQKGSFHICQVQVFGHEMSIKADMERKYMGCFNDEAEKPDLEMMVSFTWMSIPKCHRMCKRESKKYFGLQNGHVCMCGDKYGRYGRAGGNGTACDSPCKDAPGQQCGGPYQNSVYEIIR